MATSVSCPAPDQLRALLDGKLPEEAQRELNDHLEACSICQHALEGLVAGRESWIGVARQLAEADAPVDPALRDVMSAAKASAEAFVATTHPLAEAGDVLSLLKPSQESGSLGRLAHYEVLSVVGRGGMGIVLKAYDTSLRRIVAIKVMSPHLAANASARRRFVREAQAAAAVAHEHVVAIHAVEDKYEPPYLVMQYIEGKTLQDRLDRSGPLDVREILRIGMQTAAGLAAAHAQGLVHRDIKPANILLENGVERVKLTDFGLARAVDDASVTQSGVIAGTPQYMSPEQARGENVDHRSDLFSLGCVLYAVCTGHAPFRASTTMGVLKRVCDESPRPIREWNPDVPDWLSTMIDRLLAKRPEERFQTARDVADIFEKWLAHLQQPAKVLRPAVDIHGGAGSKRGGSFDTAPSLPLEVRHQLQKPAKLLVATGVLNWVGLLVSVPLLASYYTSSPPDGFIVPMVYGILAFGSGIIIFGAIRMLHGESYRWALTSTLASMLIGPGYLIGWPAGVWSLAVLTRRDVRDAFRQRGEQQRKVSRKRLAESRHIFPPRLAFWLAFFLFVPLTVLATSDVAEPRTVKILGFTAFWMWLGLIAVGAFINGMRAHDEGVAPQSDTDQLTSPSSRPSHPMFVAIFWLGIVTIVLTSGLVGLGQMEVLPASWGVADNTPLLILLVSCVASLLFMIVAQALLKGGWRATALGPRPQGPAVVLAALIVFDALLVANSAGHAILPGLSDRGQLRFEFEDPTFTVKIDWGDGQVTTHPGTDPGFPRNKPGFYVWRAYKDGRLLHSEPFRLEPRQTRVIRIPKESVESDHQNLQGRWTVMYQERAGKRLLEGGGAQTVSLVFDDQRVRQVNTELIHPTIRLVEEPYALNSAVSPKEIDLWWGGRGIYDIKGDTLSLLIAQAGSPRPGSFQTPTSELTTLTVLKRSAPDDKLIQGRWRVVRQEHWASVPKGSGPEWIEFSRNRMLMKLAGTEIVREQLFELNPAAKKRQLDLFGTQDHSHEGWGIYQLDLDSDTLTLAMGPAEHSRPSDFRSEIGRRHVVTVCQRDIPQPANNASTSTLDSRLTINLNGDWNSPWGPIEFLHDPIEPGAVTVSVKATYFKKKAAIEGTLNVASRTFDGRWNEGHIQGPIRLIIAADGQSIRGTYGFRQSGGIEDPVDSYSWDMTRSSPAGKSSAPSLPDGISWGDASPKGIQLGIALEPLQKAYRVGEKLKARLVLRNSGQTAVSTTMPRLEVLEKFGLDISLSDERSGKLPWSWGPARKTREQLTVSGAIAVGLAPGAIHELPAIEIAIGKETTEPSTLVQLEVSGGQSCRLACRLETYSNAQGEGESLESGVIEFRVLDSEN